MASEYTAEEALTATALVTGVLDRLSVPYLVGGSLASSAYGFPRSTHDADLVADLRLHHVAPFVQGLEGRFYADRERIAHGVERRTSFNLIYLPTSFRVDVFLQQPGDAARREMDRRRRVSIGGHELALAAPSDVVVHKLVWHRQGGKVSDRQWQDAVGVVRVQGPRLDRELVARCAEAAGVADLWRELLREVEEDG